MNIISVPSRFIGRGIGFNLWFAGLTNALNKGYNNFLGVLTDCPDGKSSQLCLENMRFKQFYQIYYDKFSHAGIIPFASISEAEYCSIAMRTLHSQEELWEILGNKTINLDI